MLSVTGELGRLEEFFSEVVYPAWPLWLVGAVAAALVAAYAAYHAGLYAWALRHRLISGLLAALFLAVAVPIGYYTASPLFERSTVCEASPIPGAGAGSQECEGGVAALTPPPETPEASPSASPAGDPAPGATDAPAATPFEPRVVRSGSWQGADDFHFADGEALLIETAPGRYTVRVENFSVRNGPDLFVLLSPGSDYEAGALSLGGLKGTDGAFNYEVPEGTNVSQFGSVIVWCRQFDVLFGHAALM